MLLLLENCKNIGVVHEVLENCKNIGVVHEVLENCYQIMFVTLHIY